jgi:hypothetical protein
MSDVLFVALLLGFFALCVGYVRGIDRFVRAAEKDADSLDEAVR